MSKSGTKNRIRITPEQSHNVINAGRFIFAQPHVHAARTLEYHVFLFIEYGQWDVCINGTDFTMQAGDTVILPANVSHFGKKPCLAGTMGYYAHVSWLEGDIFPCKSAQSFAFPCVISAQNSHHIGEVFKLMAQYSASGHDYARRMCASLFDQLIILLNEQPDASKKPLCGLLDDILDKNKTAILTNEQIARQTHYCLKVLERAFKKETGRSLHTYQMEYKLNQALDIMRFYPKITVTEVALMLGFYDSAHFSKAFKKQYGISPNHLFKQ